MRSSISPQAYDEAEQWSAEIVSNHEALFNPRRFQKLIKEAAKKIDIPKEALFSLVRNASVNHIKKTAPVVKRNLPSILSRYEKGASIVSLAQEEAYSPYLLARYLVEEMTTLRAKFLSEALRDPEGMLGNADLLRHDNHTTQGGNINDTGCSEVASRLAKEVRQAIDTDPLYGPMHDKERHIVGIEYEVVLEQELMALGIPFETEADLRDRGTSRTPDILLSSPMGVQVQSEDGSSKEWKMISWIDSKAMFGDVTTHRTSVLPQAEAYIHRYGPGMVLYWFGHAPLERLDNSQGDVVIVAWDLPQEFMWPTGEILRAEDKLLVAVGTNTN